MNIKLIKAIGSGIRPAVDNVILLSYRGGGLIYVISNKSKENKISL